jgi:NADH-quinone oxidoreductase subunit M
MLVLMIFLPLATAAAVLVAGARRPGMARGLSLAASIITLLLAVLLASGFEKRPDAASTPAALGNDGPFRLDPNSELKLTWQKFETTTGWTGAPKIQFYLGLDGISLGLVLLTAVLMVSAVLVSWNSINERVAEFYALLLALETGMLGVFCAFDVILFYVFFEFTLIPLFFLIGIWGGPQKRYAARKFFIYTLAGSLISLVGLVALVLALQSQNHQLFTFSIPELARGMQDQMRLAENNDVVRQFWRDAQWWILLALFVGFAVKVPLFPFHTWLPLAHVEAPTAGSVLLAGVLLKLGTYGFLRLCLPLLPYGVVDLGQPLIAALAVIGIIYGALCALAQDDIKKLVAYSSVSHLGFCMLGMVALNGEGITGSVLQMINHGLSTGALFLLVGMLYERYHTRQMQDLSGLASRVPRLTLCMVFICLSSAGLPGLNGFVGEVLCLIGMYKVHPGYAVFGAFGIVLGAWYLFTLLQKVFFGPVKEPEAAAGHVHDLNGRELFALVPIMVACVWLGVYPKPLLDRLKPDVDAVACIYQPPQAAVRSQSP